MPKRERPTWREKLQAAHEAVSAAEDERARIFRSANRAGVSYRAIEEATGVPFTTVGRWIGGSPNKTGGGLLDVEASDA